MGFPILVYLIQKITKLAINIPKAESITKNFFQEDKDGYIWIGINYGIIIKNKKGKILKKINENNSTSFNNKSYFALTKNIIKPLKSQAI